MRRSVVLKLILGAVILIGLAWLFLRTVRQTLAEPYVISGTELSGWTLVADEPDRPAFAQLALRPGGRLASELFRQIFQRTMVSLNAPALPAMPVVLQAEYAASLQAIVPVDEMVDLARQAGLENERFEPVCLALRQEALAGRTRQFYFLVFDVPAFSGFREQLARLHEARRGPGRFDPAALAPVLPIASSDADFGRWWPLEVDPGRDCQALLVVATASPEKGARPLFHLTRAKKGPGPFFRPLFAGGGIASVPTR